MLRQQGETPGLLWFPQMWLQPHLSLCPGKFPPGIPVLGQEPHCCGICVSRNCQLCSSGMDTLKPFSLCYWGEDLNLHLSPCGAGASPAFHPCRLMDMRSWIGKSYLKKFLGKGGRIPFLADISVFHKEPGEI